MEEAYIFEFVFLTTPESFSLFPIAGLDEWLPSFEVRCHLLGGFQAMKGCQVLFYCLFCC